MPVIHSQDYNVLIDENPSILVSFIEQLKPSKIFVIVDENTKLLCLPILEKYLKTPFSSIQIVSGEKFKNLKTCTLMWDALMKNKCDRKSLIINLGGGVIGDMGGFLASTYMRGVTFIQMPTTLLSQVDASVGGKLGIDFLGIKNMIGLFQNPKLVWIETQFLKTLPYRELKSGFAEVIKHGLIRSESLWQSVKQSFPKIEDSDWKALVQTSVNIKNDIVKEDPLEKGLRKILNFGHTIGHAVESHFLDSPNHLLHGEAIAIGMICEAYISYKEGLLDGPALKEIRTFIDGFYNIDLKLLPIKNEILELILKDKKNTGDQINFSLLNKIGDCIYDKNISTLRIEESLTYFDNK
ncbi:MAG: 3-dehydroquinate synthase [Saprospiraceae bacterium]|nr:3-dehydroquinate synthase [Bacteroidia bacterium]NNL91808.1 3-dehydroquinate synthase [Saprospiraceae bacterium]